jgi:exopolyphosphatase/guanosine-5'-triphosphate,3'-diphosphate pyrophosphatase
MNDVAQSMRLAAIDVGTNSIRLVVAEVDSAASYRVLDEERAQTRLGEGLYGTGRLGGEPMERSLQALGQMRAIADGMGVEELRAIATAAVREAENGRDFLRAAEEVQGVHLDVISAEEEARLAFRSIRKHFPLADTPTAIVDIGGGSLEVILSAGGMIEETHSLPLGAVRLTEQLVESDPLTDPEWKALRRTIDRMLKQGLGKPAFTTPRMIGSGGTFTAMASMAMFERQGELGPPQGYRMTREEWNHLTRRLRAAPLPVRRKMRGLNPDRADIIVAGAAAVARLARRLGTREILIHDRGIRDGLLLSMIDERFPEGEVLDAGDRFEWALRLARRCRINERHALHVAALAGQIFDGTQDLHGMGEDERELLAAAALLHDIGYLIGHAKHHKHAYHLIVHADLPGYSAREVEVIANVARYHRRARPRKKHPNFARLGAEDQRRVRYLTAILRLADGLDRTHAQAVREVVVERGDGTLRLRVDAESEPRVEIWDADRKSELFEEVVGLGVEIGWTAAVNPESDPASPS